MAHYIDADRLRAEIERRLDELNPKTGMLGDRPLRAINPKTFPRERELEKVLYLIDSLKQEQPKSSRGKFVFPNYLYARTVDNKTIDVSYAPQSMDAVEYIKNDTTEQPEVDLDEEIRTYLKTHHLHIKDGGRVVFDNNDSPNFMCDIRDIARHFAQWGAEHVKNSDEKPIPADLEEAAHSYSESDEPLYSPGHRFHWDNDSLFGKQIETTFKAGAKWQEKKDQETIKLAEDHAFLAGADWQREQMIKEAVEGIVTTRSMAGNIVTAHVDYRYKDGQKVRVIIVKED